MASPIFVSKPSDSFSVGVVLRGIQIAALSSYRSLKNPAVYTTSCIIKVTIFTVAVYIFVNIPTYILKTIIFVLKYSQIYPVNSHHILSTFHYFVNNYLNLTIFGITAISHFDSLFDDLFLVNLEFTDCVNSSQYHANLVQLPCVQSTWKEFPTSLESLNLLLRNNPRFKVFIQTYAKFYLFNLLVFLLISFPGKFTSLVLGFLSFQTFHDKLGTLPSLLLIASLSMVHYHYTAVVLIYFYSSTRLSLDLLVPFFNRINLTQFERNQWKKSRDGIIFGFGLFHFWLIKKYPFLAVVIYSIALLNMGYFVTRLSETPPPNPNQLINWNTTQLIWNRQFEVTNGDFVNEPFDPFPGSFIFNLP